MTSILDIFMTLFTGGIFGTMLYLSFKVGKIETACNYLNHRTTAMEGCLRDILAQSGGAIMLVPPTGSPKMNIIEAKEVRPMEGNENNTDSDIVVTGPRGIKVRFKEPKFQVIIALVVGFLAGMGVMEWLL